MKLQNLIIIFIIIIIPIVLIFSLYLKLEIKTIAMQMDYDEKLIEASKEAMEAFEINTTEWNNEYSTLANTKRQDLMSSINVFTSSLASKLGVGGTSKENILSYVPAIVFTMYDGYYIYSPTHVPQTITTDTGIQLFYYKDSGSEGAKVTASATQNIGGIIYEGEPIYELKDGETATGIYNGKSYTTDRDKARTTYKHVLKTFVPYTKNYEVNGKKYVINYTLDNYIRIYSEDVAKEGYIIENFYNAGTCRMTVPIDSISGIKFDVEEIKPEVLTESIPVRDSMTDVAVVKTYAYVYNSSNDKRYYDPDTDKFFTVNKNYVKVYLPDTTVGTTVAEYKKVLIRLNTTDFEYVELYQLLNGSNDTWYSIDSNNQYIEYIIYQPAIDKNQDCSAINYYVENYDFNEWLRDLNGLNLSEDEIQEVIDGKNQAIIENISNNLNLSMSNYSANSKIDYKLPELTDKDWEQALSNISMITFFQGAKIGLKTYNNYVVVSSTQNNEYVGEDSLYYMDSQDEYYHRYGCSSAKTSIGQDGTYRNTEFKVKTYSYEITGAEDYLGYYYKHATINVGGTNSSIQECFDCIVNRNNLVEDTTNYEQAFYAAIARERYVQTQRTRLTNSNATIFELEELKVLPNISTTGNSRTITLAITGGTGYYTITWRYRTSNVAAWVTDSLASDKITYTRDKTYYIQYEVEDTITGEIVTGTIDADLEALAVTHSTSSIGNNRTISLAITGGSGTYTVTWRYKTTAIGTYTTDISAANQTTYTNNKTYYVQYTVRDTVTGETVTNTINGEVTAGTTEFNVTYTQTTLTNGIKVTFTISGGTAPYSYQVRAIDGLWETQIPITGTTLTRTVTSGRTLTIRFLDSAGNTKTITIIGSAQMY